MGCAYHDKSSLIPATFTNWYRSRSQLHYDPIGRTLYDNTLSFVTCPSLAGWSFTFLVIRVDPLNTLRQHKIKTTHFKSSAEWDARGRLIELNKVFWLWVGHNTTKVV